ncbi:hypothetical protein D3C75_1276380 [compost metagenome]
MVEVFASWNGSTETAAWQVLAGPTPYCLSIIIESTPRTGFETKICLKSDGPYYQVNALDSCGFVIGTSMLVNLED